MLTPSTPRGIMLQVYGRDLQDAQRERAKERNAAKAHARTSVYAGAAACLTSSKPTHPGLALQPGAHRQDAPGHIACSSNELRERLKKFYSMWSPDRASRVEAIVRTFEQRGAGSEALRELNEELREVYGRDLACIADAPRTTPPSARRDAAWGILRKNVGTGPSPTHKATAQRQMLHEAEQTTKQTLQAGCPGDPMQKAGNQITQTHKAQEGTRQQSFSSGDSSSLSPGSITKTGFLSSAFLGDALERARRVKEERIRGRESERASDDLHARNGVLVDGGGGSVADDETSPKDAERRQPGSVLRERFFVAHQNAVGGIRDGQPASGTGDRRRTAYTDLEEADQDAVVVANVQGFGLVSPLVKSPLTASPYSSVASLRASSVASMRASSPYFSSPREIAAKNEERMQHAADEAAEMGGEKASKREGEMGGKEQGIKESDRNEIAIPESGSRKARGDGERGTEKEASDQQQGEIEQGDMDKGQRNADAVTRDEDEGMASAAAALELVKEKERERRRREDEVAARLSSTRP